MFGIANTVTRASTVQAMYSTGISLSLQPCFSRRMRMLWRRQAVGQSVTTYDDCLYIGIEISSPLRHSATCAHCDPEVLDPSPVVYRESALDTVYSNGLNNRCKSTIISRGVGVSMTLLITRLCIFIPIEISR
jgi:hypothetical protein